MCRISPFFVHDTMMIPGDDLLQVSTLACFGSLGYADLSVVECKPSLTPGAGVLEEREYWKGMMCNSLGSNLGRLLLLKLKLKLKLIKRRSSPITC